MAALREVLANFDVNVDTEELETSNGLIEGLQENFGELLAGLGAIMGLRGLQGFTLALASAADDTAKFGEVFGVTVREIGIFREVIQNAGGSAGDADGAIRSLASAAEAARTGSTGARRAFSRLGIGISDVVGPTSDLGGTLQTAIINLQRIQNPLQRVTVANEVFGGAGEAFVRISNAGSEALEEQIAIFDQYNSVTSETFLSRSQDAIVAQDNLRNVTDALSRSIGAALLPGFNRLTEATVFFLQGFQQLTQGTLILETAFTLLAVAAGVAAINTLAAFAVPIAIAAGIAAAVVGVIAIVEDLFILFSGGESAIGGAIDAIFGIGATEEVIAAVDTALFALFDGFVAIGEFFTDDLPAAYEASVEATADAIGATVDFFSNFGDSISQLVDDTAELFVEGFTAIGEFIDESIDSAIDGVISIFEGFREFLSNAVSAYIDLISGFVDAIFGVGTAQSIIDGLSDAWNDLGGTARATLRVFQSNIIPAINRVAAGAGRIVNSIVDSFRTAFETISEIFNDIAQLVDSTIGTIGDVAGSIGDFFDFDDEPMDPRALAGPALNPAEPAILRGEAPNTGRSVINNFDITSPDAGLTAQIITDTINEQARDDLEIASDTLVGRSP